MKPSLLGTSLISLFLLVAPLANAKEAEPVPKVVLVVIDGVRALEMHDQATDDYGKRVKSAELLPTLTALEKKGMFFPEMRIQNPAGVSLPAYADIFAGRRQDKIIDNHPPKEDMHSHNSTIFEVLQGGLKLNYDDLALFSSWEPICAIATVSSDEKKFYQSCGWKNGLHKGEYFKPELYPGSRTDMDTFVELAQEMPKRHPLFTFVHLVNADEEGHFQESVMNKTRVNYGIFNYHNALHEDDYYVGRIWQMLQTDPFYKDSTYLIVTTDHGRDNFPDPKQWATHGDCVKKSKQPELCSGCRHVFAVIVGPGIKHGVVTKNYTHTDIAPTIARLMGVAMPTATGKPIPEIAK